MKFLRVLVLSALSMEMAFGFQGAEDPVMAARAQRAAAQGIADADLPPVPKGIAEPPPLPSPEIHPRDTRGYKAARRSRHGKRSKAMRRGKGHRPAPKKRHR